VFIKNYYDPAIALAAKEQERISCTTSARPAGYKPHYLGGRCWNGAHRDAGKVVHAVRPLTGGGSNFNTAVCGRTPGGRSYGLAETADEVNCPRCKKCMGEMGL
jgi:hypothetical protein